MQGEAQEGIFYPLGRLFYPFFPGPSPPPPQSVVQNSESQTNEVF